MSTQARVEAEMAKCIESLRMQLFAKSEFGLSRLGNAFGQVDYDGSGMVTRQDFNDVLNYCSLFLSEQNLTTVQKYFSQDPNKCKVTEPIPINSFMAAMLIPMSPRRMSIVAKAWNSLGGGDQVDTRTMISNYSAAGHIYVRQGSHSADDILDKFASSFVNDITTKVCGYNYYTSRQIPAFADKIVTKHA